MKGWLVSDRMFPSRSCAPSPRRLISALSNSLCKCSIEHQPRPRATAVNSSYTGLLTHVLEHHTTENQGERSLNEKRERKEEEKKKTHAADCLVASPLYYIVTFIYPLLICVSCFLLLLRGNKRKTHKGYTYTHTLLQAFFVRQGESHHCVQHMWSFYSYSQWHSKKNDHIISIDTQQPGTLSEESEKQESRERRRGFKNKKKGNIPSVIYWNAIEENLIEWENHLSSQSKVYSQQSKWRTRFFEKGWCSIAVPSPLDRQIFWKRKKIFSLVSIS